MGITCGKTKPKIRDVVKESDDSFLKNVSLRESKILKSLQKHNNIVRMKSVSRIEKKYVISMEKCKGGDLFDAVNRFNTHTTKSIVRQILDGIAYIHKNGYIHCDIKLENIMLTDESQDSPVVRIIDFGSTQLIKNHGEGCIGTMGYISPDIIMGKYNEKTDMWSLGVVVFILIFKFNPFNPRGYQGNHYSSIVSKKIMKGFSSEVKAGYGAFFPAMMPRSELVRDFISRMLTSDKDSRMSPEEALNHPWLNS